MSGRNLKRAALLAGALGAAGCEQDEPNYAELSVAAESCKADMVREGVRADMMEPYLTADGETVMIPGEIILDEHAADSAKDITKMIKVGALEALLQPGTPNQCSDRWNEWGDVQVFDQGVGGPGKVGFVVKVPLDRFPSASGDELSVTSMQLVTGGRDGSCLDIIPSYEGKKNFVITSPIEPDSSDGDDWSIEEGTGGLDEDPSCPSN